MSDKQWIHRGNLRRLGGRAAVRMELEVTHCSRNYLVIANVDLDGSK